MLHNWLNRIAVPAAITILASSICGCDTIQPFYEGPERPRDQVALIPVYKDVAIDQRRGDVIRKHIALLPGKHTADMLWRSGATCRLEFVAIAGAEYRVTDTSVVESGKDDSSNTQRTRLTARLIQVRPNTETPVGVVAECSDILILFVVPNK
jgi:hypothetical protein